MKQFFFSAIMLACIVINAGAQNTFPSTGAVGIGTALPDASSLLEIKSTAKGLLIPRMSKNQRDAIPAPATGLMIYQTNSTPGFYFYNGTLWTAVASIDANTSLSNLSATSINKDLIADTANKRSFGSSDKPWLNAYFSGKVGIGTTNPTNKLEIVGNVKITGTVKVADGTQAAGKVFTSDAYGLGSWQTLPANTGWSLTGNAGTNAANNFIGTTDAQNLVFKVNNQAAGFIGYDAAKANTGYGFQTLNANTTGINNTASGYYALKQNTTGFKNTATGANSLYSNTTGYNNTANGFYALYSNDVGNLNTATGVAALFLNTSGSYNTATGVSSLLYNTIGNNNTGIGYQSLYSNATGSWNTALGDEALYANTTGIFNTASGYYALNKNTTGDRNSATGSYTMFNNTTGRKNTAIGVDALLSNTTGSTNVANGFEALHNNTTGYSNVALGVDALYSNVIGFNHIAIGDSVLYNSAIPYIDIAIPNIGIGSKALFNSTTAYGNMALGVESMYTNTIGVINTAIGLDALYHNTEGSENIAMGYAALLYNDIGGENVAVGDDALSNNRDGYDNTAIGTAALIQNESGSRNTSIGVYAGLNNYNLSNATAVGAYATATAENQVMLGSTSVTSVMAAGSYVVYSDGRFKKNIKQNVPGLEFIKQLKPVTYNYDIHKLNAFIQPEERSANNKINKEKFHIPVNEKQHQLMEAAIVPKEKKTYTGFIAQDVEKIAEKMGFSFSGVYKPQNDKDPYGLSYGEFVMPLVKAVQELSAENDSLKKNNALQIEYLQKQIDDLKAMMSSANKIVSATDNTQTIKLNNVSSLEQNIPNPYSNSTIINYTLPVKYSNAKLIITDKAGKTIKQISLTGSGKGSVQIDASSLSNGTYHYTLYADGKLMESKQMIVSR